MKILSKEIAKEMISSGNEKLMEIAYKEYPELKEIPQYENNSDQLIKFDGYWIDDNSNILHTRSGKNNYNNRNIFPTEKEAIRYGIILPELLQWRDKANGKKLEDWCDWRDVSQKKYYISIICGEIHSNTNVFHNFKNEPLVFKTQEIRELFMSQHKDLLQAYSDSFS